MRKLVSIMAVLGIVFSSFSTSAATMYASDGIKE